MTDNPSEEIVEWDVKMSFRECGWLTPTKTGYVCFCGENRGKPCCYPKCPKKVKRRVKK